MSETQREKVQHVKAAKQSRSHTCHWPGCDKQVPPAMWGCKGHWFALPKALRDRIWATYRRGQEERMDPSPEYLKAADDAQLWIRELSRIVRHKNGKARWLTTVPG